jgi:hypothetical protein
MNRLIVAAVLLTTTASSASAGQRPGQDAVAMQPCTIEVLHSEMIPVGPLFHHTIRTTLLVSLSDRPPFETTVQRVIPVQFPPPRQGLRLRTMCDPAELSTLTLF